ITHLNDTHKQLMVHWVGENSKVVICLARDPAAVIAGFTNVNPSAVFISYDDGNTYENKTDNFKMANGSFGTLEKFYNHPKYNTHFVFTDIKHNLMYVTTDYGRNFKRLDLNFTPSDVSFHELHPSTFVVLDKNDTYQKLWITEDFGRNFRVAHEFVKAFYWMKDDNDNQLLTIQRFEPTGLSSIIYSKNLFKSRASHIYATNVKDFFFRGDYLFTTRTNAKGNLELYVSYKLGKSLLCVFNTVQTFKAYYIVDVTGSRALVVVSHADNASNLYASENLGGNNGEVKFTLSLEDVFAYFPNSTWQYTWLQHTSEDAFADVYKVEGLSGIYIASKVILKNFATSLGPQHMASVITYDHGATWRPIQPPAYDLEGQSTGCIVTKNCSLHLSQKFSQWYPDTRSVSILSSKSAPGIIIATGVLGRSLKGHHCVYVSLDAGLTWHQTLREPHFFNMGDHGGILTAVKYYKVKGETRHILYSTNEGKYWNSTQFHNEDIRLYGLMTEPGQNTTVFTMFGSLPEAHQWIIVKVDFKTAFNRTCTDDDYKMWSPSQSDENRSYIPCVLGEQTTYQRRMSHANCLNGLDYVRVVSKQSCDCDVLDFECDFGFKKVGNPHRCIRDASISPYYPYEPDASCKPGKFYNRTKGYRKISGDACVGGFESHYLPDLVPCPFNEVEDFVLFAQRERISRYNLVTKTLEELPVKNLKNVIAIDFDMSTNCVYWADIALDTIGRQCLSNGSKPEILVSSDLSSIEGMAFDWISKALYFVDGIRSKIELIRTDINHSGRMRRTILDSRILRKPRGIALHPQNGYMFWTDWSAENPSINRANLDGSNNITLFGRDKVEWPNGITVDYIANRIYWVDARQDYIGSSDLHGDGFVKVVSDTQVVSHPFAIAVFKNEMFWDDWKRNSIFAADKENYKGVEVFVKQLPGLMDLKIFAHGIQIGTNACTNSSCPYICVGLPKNKHTCLCPDGLDPKNGKCMCPGNTEPLGVMTCPSVDNSCSSDHFACGNGYCVPKGWRCDEEDDCGDNSDEFQCGSHSCPPSSFICGDGKCLPHYWKCDYDADCTDGSDELNCPKQNCTDGQFACENGRCISSKWRCDGENDCRDGSDERNCNPEQPSSCKLDEFQCGSGAVKCIPSTWKCDEEADCRDGSDEHNCSNNTCTSYQFSCGPPTNRCIYNTWVCDGDKDCPTGIDEMNCTSIKPELPRPPNPFVVVNGTCQDWMFMCQNSRCIPIWWKCDGADDCVDGSDEMGCPNKSDQNTTVVSTIKPQSICEHNQYQCLSGSCIFSSWVCDGMYDCESGEDENNCDDNRNCSKTEFKCRMDGSCIALNSVCNGVVDCPDATDELSCEHNLPNGPATPSCSIGLFPCDGGSCFPLAALCDGQVDCKDGYDETNCTKKTRIYQVMQMGTDERGSNSSSLLLHWLMLPQNNVHVEFLPSISKVGDNKWKNGTWKEDMAYLFNDLEPFTKYNMTVYVRVKNSTTVFLPARYYVASTSEGVPSEPLNVTVEQRNGSHILISWQPPKQPNGIITFYDILLKTLHSTETQIRLTGNETSHLLLPDFEHNMTYTFWVVAHNKKYQSKKSEPAKLIFDAETLSYAVKEIRVNNVSDEGVSLSWKYDGDADGFNVTVHPDKPYPDLPPSIVKTNNITMKLAPGANYHFEINAFKKGLIGPVSSISARTTGNPLPSINTLVAMSVKDVGTSAKLSWERPKYSKKLNWVYGIYYGINHEEIFKKPQQTTTNEMATITNLDACEIYFFAVGIVGPIGYGPLSTTFTQISTSVNPKAPPKKVQVIEEGQNSLKLKVQWVPSCPTVQPKNYIIKVYAKLTTQTWHVRVEGTANSYVFNNIAQGGVYEISIATEEINATYSKPVTYSAPLIPAPYEVQVDVEDNGKYIVYWQERELSSQNFEYEVLVHEGNTLNESTAEKYTVKKPPFIYINTSADTYTFAVRIKTATGLRSMTSELVSKKSEMQRASESVNMPAIIVPSLLILIALITVITILVIRNRKLHNSFTRFANSHYDTRSEAATFDDNGLEEDESPHIRGFSDDEPLVIA
ncbi:hypothetical protein NQ317_013098, partial [Molorchus minor]